MTTLEDIKELLSLDICDWCEFATKQGEYCEDRHNSKKSTMCKAASEARAQDVYERFVNPLEKKVNLLSMWTETYADYGVAMKDAAEFEARVNEKVLLSSSTHCSRDENGKRVSNCPKGKDVIDCVTVLDSRRCLLRLARIAVESEMEEKRK